MKRKIDNNVGGNLKRVCYILQKTMKKTKIAQAMGYTTTTQLDKTLNGNASLSQKAILDMIKNLNINPTFLFTGTGTMFLHEEKPDKKPVLRIEYTYVTSTL
jgi:hypothetical protein